MNYSIKNNSNKQTQLLKDPSISSDDIFILNLKSKKRGWSENQIDKIKPEVEDKDDK